MASNVHASEHANWWIWGGAAVAAIVVIAALGVWLDWFGNGAPETGAPAVEQSAPVTE